MKNMFGNFKKIIKKYVYKFLKIPKNILEEYV
jgi:hypothetical protein